MVPMFDLVPGQNVALLDSRVIVALDSQSNPPDLVALLVNGDGAVRGDHDFVFYNSPAHPSACVRLVGTRLEVDLALVPDDVQRVVVAIDADAAPTLGKVAATVLGEQQSFRFEPAEVAPLPTAVVVELYRRTGTWRIRALGQGWADGLEGLATSYGVEIESPDLDGVGGQDDTDDTDRLVSERDAVLAELGSLHEQLREARAALVETDERMLLQEVGFYQLRHPLDEVPDSKRRLTELQTRIKRSITQRSAVHSTNEWMVNGSLREGKELVRQFADLMLRTYNIEADNCVRTVRAHTVPTVIKRLDRTREAIARNGATMGVAIDDSFHALRLDELKLTADHHLRVERQKEEAREERQRQREEVRAQDEFRRRKKDLFKEQAHYEGLLTTSLQSGDQTAEAAARERLAEISDQIEEVEEMAANTRVGHVYVISNVGAFGDRVVKIGLTRREDPRQRVYELGSASVPFRFDIHALAFSKDAVALETALHRHFDEVRVNKVNRRREFFRTTPEAVLSVLEELGENHVIEFRSLPEAPEWRQGRASAEHGVSLRRARGSAALRINEGTR